MLSQRSLILSVVVLCAAVRVGWAEGRADDPPHRDLICGPRAVEFILKQYGRETPDTIDIVREVQWPDVGAGSTLDRLIPAIEKRGIHTLAVRLPADSRLRWPHPILACIDASPDRGGGHFVVVMGDDGGEAVQIWVGLNGYRELTREEFQRRCSGVVVLTSPTPVTFADVRATTVRDWTGTVLWLAFVPLIGVELLLLARLARTLTARPPVPRPVPGATPPADERTGTGPGARGSPADPPGEALAERRDARVG